MLEELTPVLGDFSQQLRDANLGTRSRQTGSGANSPAYFPCLAPPIPKLHIGLLNYAQVSPETSQALEGASIGSTNTYWDSGILSEYK